MSNQKVKSFFKIKNFSDKIPIWNKRDTAQNSIPYDYMTKDGIADLGNGHYSVTFELSDINYNNTSEENRINIFEKYCKFLNSFSQNTKIQLHIENCPLSKTKLNVLIDSSSDNSDKLNKCIDEYNEMQESRLIGSDSFIKKKYITLTISADSLDEAIRKFIRLESDSMSELTASGCRAMRLNHIDRLYLLRNIYRPDDYSVISNETIAKTGVYGKDLITPYSIDTTNENYLKFDDFYTKTLFITNLPEELSDEIIGRIMDVEENIFITMNIEPQNPQEQIQKVKDKLKKLKMDKTASEISQAKSGVMFPEAPMEVLDNIESAKEFLSDLKKRHEKVFMANMLIHVRGKNIKELNDIVDKITVKVNANDCALKPFTFGHEDGFNSVLPLGRNNAFIKRTLTTSSTAVFIPFNVLDLVQRSGFSYGKNTLSNNLIYFDRRRLQNPHGFILGASGSGKSMGVKAEIWECFWRNDDDIIIIDPDGEFVKLVNMLGGQVIDISASSQTYFNPFNFSLSYSGDDDESPLAFKSNFIISLIEAALNFHDGIDMAARSIIDRVILKIYDKYMKTKKDIDIPTFKEFYEILKQQPEDEAKAIAIGLEIYVHGTMNIFANRTNVELNNRLICFNTKNLSSQLKNMGMMIVQDFCWNRITQNQILNSKTWLWNDEIHHSLRNPTTCEWLATSWKRGRKYGLIATGMIQEANECFIHPGAKSLIANSEFILLYHQTPEMLNDLDRVIELTAEQKKNLLSCEQGTGILKAGNTLIEFSNRYPEGTDLYSLMQTNVGKTKAL